MRWALDPFLRLRDGLAGLGADRLTAAGLPVDRRCREVSELRDTLADLVGRLSHALEGARSFSAEAAHELKTPLTTIRAELELLSEEPLGENERAAVGRLHQRAVALSSLVERLLLLATVGDAQVEHRTVAIEDIVRATVAALPETLRTRIVLDLQGQGMVRGEEALLTVLVENILDNALKFSAEQPVEARLRDTTEGAVLVVRDVGPGIDEGLRSRVFQPFFRSPQARGANAPGHGLGLAIAARIAHAHEGSLAFTDVEDDRGGAQIQLVLPSWTSAGSAGVAGVTSR